MGKRSKPAARVIKRLALDDIAVEGGTQSRAGLDADTVKDYARLYVEREPLPEPVVFHDGEVYWLSSGFHRIAAARLAKFTEINCEVRKGGTLEAFVYGLQANATHGLPRNHHDKRFAVKQALKRQTIKDKSDREVAKICCVSHDLVRTIRIELSGVNVTLPANDSAEVPKTTPPAPAPAEARNGAGDLVDVPSDSGPGQDEGAGAGLTRAPGIEHAIDGMERDYDVSVRDELISDNRPRDPGAPIPCPNCNPSGTSATAGWVAR